MIVLAYFRIFSNISWFFRCFIPEDTSPFPVTLPCVTPTLSYTGAWTWTISSSTTFSTSKTTESTITTTEIMTQPTTPTRPTETTTQQTTPTQPTETTTQPTENTMEPTETTMEPTETTSESTISNLDERMIEESSIEAFPSSSESSSTTVSSTFIPWTSTTPITMFPPCTPYWRQHAGTVTPTTEQTTSRSHDVSFRALRNCSFFFKHCRFILKITKEFPKRL